MISVQTKPAQKTEYVVRRGNTPVYRGDSAQEARNVAKSIGENASTTFRTEAGVKTYLSTK